MQLMWTPLDGSWVHHALPYVIQRRADFADLMPGGVLESFEVRNGGETLAIRFSLGAAMRYAEERWVLLDGVH